MNLIKNIYKTARMIVIPCCMLTACNYLDVIPPAQADFEDTMKDQNAVENFLFTLKSATPFPKCYLHKEKWTFDS